MQRVLSIVLSIPGVCVLAALDSTPFYYLPFGVDAAVILVAARHEKVFWLVGLMAAAASLSGAAFTFKIGERIGERGIRHFVPQGRIEDVDRRLHESGAVALALLDLIPPPFPFTACILAAGGLRTDRKTFLTTLLFTRFVRFGGESIIAAVWGPQIVSRIESEAFAIVAIALVVLGLLGGMFSLYRAVRQLKRVATERGRRVISQG